MGTFVKSVLTTFSLILKGTAAQSFTATSAIKLILAASAWPGILETTAQTAILLTTQTRKAIAVRSRIAKTAPEIPQCVRNASLVIRHATAANALSFTLR